MEDRYSKKAVGARLKELRVSLGQTQKQFAEKMNWDVNTYRKIETGVSLLTSDKAQMLYETYEIDITYILTGVRPTSEDFLKKVWITADRAEKKELIGRLLSYFEELL